MTWIVLDKNDFYDWISNIYTDFNYKFSTKQAIKYKQQRNDEEEFARSRGVCWV